MVKAAAWRLAHLLHMRPGDLLATEDLHSLLDKAVPGQAAGDAGEAARLASKIQRLRPKPKA